MLFLNIYEVTYANNRKYVKDQHYFSFIILRKPFKHFKIKFRANSLYDLVI